MDYINWNKSLLVNINEVDKQHRNLFNKINELHHNLVSGSGSKVLNPLIASLFEYADVHFSTEEKYMKKYEYPEFDVQKKEHNEFIIILEGFNKKYKEGSPLLAREILLYLGNWFRKHILENDKKIGIYLKKQGIT